MIQLHPHGQTAYNSILRLLPETHKAAVIHPTGTGKSFIAFRLVQQFAEKRFVWLSFSETIFKTQCQNVERAYRYRPEDVTPLGRVPPLRGKGMEPQGTVVLKMYPDAMLVGLSATNIRYLDNQQDMALELFDGCIAEQIMLSEEKRKRLEVLNPAWQEWLDSHPSAEQNRDYMSFEYGYPYAIAYHHANSNLRVPRSML